MKPQENLVPIDVVITWVDGEDPVLRKKRNEFLSEDKKQPAIATKTRRFSDNGEILFCLKSIATHMPWVNRVYIVTDNQVPLCVREVGVLPLWFHEKIRVVDHAEIFEGFHHLLPTFNSLSIETLLWRIQGLSERFLYLNDDMFFCGPIKRYDFFQGNKVLLRGKWEEWNGIEKLSFHGENNKRGAALTEWKGQKFFRAVHVAHPMIKSILEDAFAASPELFEKNAAWRFRSRKQFWPVSLHNHLAFAQRRAKRKRDGSDWVHFSVAFCRDASPADIQKKLTELKSRNNKLACLNYAEAVMEKVPRAMRHLDKVTQPSMLQKLCDKLESI